MKVAFLKNSTLYFSYLSIVKHITLVHLHHWTLNHGTRISRIIYIDSSLDDYVGHSQYFSIPNITCHEQSCEHLLAHVCSSWKEAPLSCPVLESEEEAPQEFSLLRVFASPSHPLLETRKVTVLSTGFSPRSTQPENSSYVPAKLTPPCNESSEHPELQQYNSFSTNIILISFFLTFIAIK